jgi:hypothetical protein
MSSANPQATQKYAEKFPAFLKAGHYRDFNGLHVSSLSIFRNSISPPGFASPRTLWPGVIV